MQRIIVTGANGTGKSHFASRLALARPGIPVVSFDGIKLRTRWRQRPWSEIDVDLAVELEREAWILEGGPSLLSLAIGKADGLVWLDPPEHIRIWRLAVRPWKNFGKTRPGLPPGNVEWPWQQYRFALRSIRKGPKFRTEIAEAFRRADERKSWRCRDEKDLAVVLANWAEVPV